MTPSTAMQFPFEASVLSPEREAELDAFATYLDSRNMSENTIQSYTFALRQFFSLYPEISFSNMKLYKLFLLEHYKPQTVNLRIRALNSFIEFQKLNPGRRKIILNMSSVRQTMNT